MPRTRLWIIAACLVAADTRADVNTVVRKLLDVRKASFLPMDRAVVESGMEYGGITPIGLPQSWPVLVDARVVAMPHVIIGSGVRHSKIAIAGPALGALPGAEVIEGTSIPAESGFSTSLWLGAGAALVAALFALAISPRRRARQEAPAATTTT